MDKFLTIKLTLSDYPGKVDTYLSRIDNSPQGASHGQGCCFTLPIIPNNSPSFEIYFRSLAEDSNAEKQLRDLGIALYRSIFQDGVKEKWDNLLGQFKSEENCTLRIALNILSSKLVNVPWELLHDENEHLLRTERISIVRVIDELIAPRKSFGPIISPLIIVANPGGLFNAEEHVENIKQEFIQANVLPTNIKTLTKASTENIFDFLSQNKDGDFLYFMGHGKLNGNDEGVITLESSTSPDGTDIQAGRFAAALRKTNIRFVYLNSCSTGVLGSGTFSGVGQKVMLGGDVVSVIAMQAPINAKKGREIAALFIRKILQIETIETALSSVRNEYLNDSFTWAIPTIYTYLQGPEEFEKNQLLSLLGSSTREEQYALCIPAFRQTLLEEEISSERYEIQIKIKGKNINTIYHYPGLSFALSDVTATNYITQLLLRVTSHDNIKLVKGSIIQDETHSKCIFLFGSRSNTYVSQVVNGYSPIFTYTYTETEWYIIDNEYKKKYSIKTPFLSSTTQFNNIVDYCCIQKIVSPSKNVYFLISGLGDRGTVGGSWWLVNNWKFLLKEHGINKFSHLIRIPTSNYATAELVNRANNEWGESID